MVVLPTLIAPSPAATGSASLAKRDVRPVRLGTPVRAETFSPRMYATISMLS